VGPIRSFVVAVVAAGSLAGCAAGLHDETSSERSTPYVAGAVIGGLKVRDVAVIAAGSSSQAPAASPAAGDTGQTQGSLTMVVVNNGAAPDSITGVQVGDNGGVTPTNPDASATIDPGQSVIFGAAAGGGTDSTASDLSISGLSAPLQPGTTIKVTVTFQTAGQVVLQAPVLSAPAG
jgi:plastocyanin